MDATSSHEVVSNAGEQQFISYYHTNQPKSIEIRYYPLALSTSPFSFHLYLSSAVFFNFLLAPPLLTETNNLKKNPVALPKHKIETALSTSP